jgi:hypothetical protein
MEDKVGKKKMGARRKLQQRTRRGEKEDDLKRERESEEVSTLLGLSDPKDEGAMIFRNVGNY